MTLDLANYELKTQNAIRHFWTSRQQARTKQIDSGNVDQGERASVTAGKNMDGFITLVQDILQANGLTNAKFYKTRSLLTLPGYFRATKIWDVIVMNDKELVAAIEFKSQVGPSFGNNFNNRAEEAIGTAKDFWIAYRENTFLKQPKPFLGWLMLVEDAPRSRMSVKTRSPHFPVDNAFENSSYLERYDVFCRRLIQEQLYTTASVIASPSSADISGEFTNISPMTSLKMFVTELAAHAAKTSARL